MEIPDQAAFKRVVEAGRALQARLWKYLIEDLHPGICVVWEETHREIGV